MSLGGYSKKRKKKIIGFRITSVLSTLVKQPRTIQFPVNYYSLQIMHIARLATTGYDNILHTYDVCSQVLKENEEELIGTIEHHTRLLSCQMRI